MLVRARRSYLLCRIGKVSKVCHHLPLPLTPTPQYRNQLGRVAGERRCSAGGAAPLFLSAFFLVDLRWCVSVT